MIGNWILHSETNEKCQVVDIDPSGVRCLFKNQEVCWVEAEQFEPIVLSKDVLENIGFSECYKSDFTHRFEMKDATQWEYVYSTSSVSNYIRLNGQVIAHVYNVHKFQNLFFLLTGNVYPIKW